MVEVIAFLFEGFINRQIDMQISLEQIARELPEAGFSNDEIDFAMIWLDDTLNHEHLDVKALNSCDGFRIYNEFEEKKLDEEARGLLYFLEQNKMITPAVRELIIDRALALHINYVGKEEMRWVLLFVMMNSNARNDILIWIEKSIADIVALRTSPQKLVEA